MIHEPISNTQNTCYFIEISLLILVQYWLLFHYFANFTSSKTKKKLQIPSHNSWDEFQIFKNVSAVY